MIKIGKYLQEQIIFLCYELQEEKEPNFYFQNIYTIDDLVNLCKLFLLYKKRNKLFKVFLNIFNNNNVKISKDVYDFSNIKLMIYIVLPDGDNSVMTLQLYRKEKTLNETF